MQLSHSRFLAIATGIAIVILASGALLLALIDSTVRPLFIETARDCLMRVIDRLLPWTT